ncbi:hypothetical protein ACFQ0D_04745 [Micromonospora zhanjiangensis]
MHQVRCGPGRRCHVSADDEAAVAQQAAAVDTAVVELFRRLG